MIDVQTEFYLVTLPLVFEHHIINFNLCIRCSCFLFFNYNMKYEIYNNFLETLLYTNLSLHKTPSVLLKT